MLYGHSSEVDYASVMLLLGVTLSLALSDRDVQSDETMWDPVVIEEEEAWSATTRRPIATREPLNLSEITDSTLVGWLSTSWWENEYDPVEVLRAATFEMGNSMLSLDQKTTCAVAMFACFSITRQIQSQEVVALRQVVTARETEERLRAVADAGDSEAGQLVMRDLMTSFLAPRVEIGLRRTLISASEQKAFIIRNYAENVQRANSAMLRTTSIVWRDESEEALERTCALLAGAAVLLSPDMNTLRKGDAYGGRIRLPFLNVARPANGSLIEMTQDQWTCLQLRNDVSCVQYSGKGLDALKRCMLILMSNEQA